MMMLEDIGLDCKTYKARATLEKGFVKRKLKLKQTTPVVITGTNQFVGVGDVLIVPRASKGENSISENFTKT